MIEDGALASDGVDDDLFDDDGKTYGADDVESVDAAAREAEAKGFTVIRSSPHHLLLDLDDGLERFENMRPLLDEKFGIEDEERWLSKSGRWHVRVMTKRYLPALMRVALQAILGSDPVRELLAADMVNRDVPMERGSMLFRPPRLLTAGPPRAPGITAPDAAGLAASSRKGRG